MSTGFIIVERKDLKIKSWRKQRRSEITAFIAALPADGKGIAKVWESERAAFNAYIAVRGRIKRHSLSLDCFKRGTTIYLFRKETK